VTPVSCQAQYSTPPTLPPTSSPTNYLDGSFDIGGIVNNEVYTISGMVSLTSADLPVPSPSSIGCYYAGETPVTAVTMSNINWWVSPVDTSS
jgi:hypothetical protein